MRFQAHDFWKKLNASSLDFVNWRTERPWYQACNIRIFWNFLWLFKLFSFFLGNFFIVKKEWFSKRMKIMTEFFSINSSPIWITIIILIYWIITNGVFWISFSQNLVFRSLNFFGHFWISKEIQGSSDDWIKSSTYFKISWNFRKL